MYTQPKPRQGYGRRRPARDHLIDSCFTSSSPIKETKAIEGCEVKALELLESLQLEDKENAVSVVLQEKEQRQKTKTSSPQKTEQGSASTSQKEKEKALWPRNPNERRAFRLSNGSPAKAKSKKSKVVEILGTSSVEQTSFAAPQVIRCEPPTRRHRTVLEIPETPLPAPKTDTPIQSQDDGLVQELESLKLSSKPHRTKRHRPRKVQPAPKILHAATTPEIIAHAQPLLTLCNDSHAQSSPFEFQAWADSLSPYFEVKKIAEASYGEVFRLVLLPTVQTTFTKADESVLKLIALKAPPLPTPLTQAQKKKQGSMSAVDHVASEVRLLKRMSPVPGFTNFRDVKVVQGRLPKQFCSAWRHYQQNVRASVFPDPSRKAAYDETQLWAVVEMQDAGTDLESSLELESAEEDENGYVEQQWLSISVWAGWDVFWHVACAVAKGEGWAEFEHRDLHLGNICIRTNNSQPLQSQLTSTIPTNTNKRNGKLGFTALEATIIDYTLSRANMNTELETAEDIAYLNLSADPAVFEGDGDMEYQYDIYRHMRGEVLFDDPTITTAQVKPARKGRKPKSKLKQPQQQEEEQKDPVITPDEIWRAYHPATNLIWLHFVLYQLMTVIEPPCSSMGRNGRENDQMAKKLYARLTLLNEEKLTMEGLKRKDWGSASDMVAWAVEEGWLNEADVVGAGYGGV